jgi:predicted nucleic acid-binding protein
MQLRVYLDTSVVSALLDDRTPDRQGLTREFFEHLDDYEAVTSELAKEELGLTPDPARLAEFQQILGRLEIAPVTAEMRALAMKYLAAGIFGPGQFQDALHVAAAVSLRCDLLVSWNFRHLVNRRRRALVNGVNVSLGLPSMEIVAPPEV